ncbi:MAG: GGDEF domain-containing protein [bacterium]
MRFNRLELYSSLIRASFFLCVSLLDFTGKADSAILADGNFVFLYTLILFYVVAPILLREHKGNSNLMFAIDSGVLLIFLADVGFDSLLSAFAPFQILSAYFRGSPSLALAVAIGISAIFCVAHLATGTFLLFREFFTLIAFPFVYVLIRIGHYAGGYQKYRQMYLDLEKNNRELEEHIKLLEQKVSTHTIIDPITNLKNFRYFRARIEEEIARAIRRKSSFSLCVAEVDDFDLFVSLHGNRERDKTLQKVAQLLTDCMRTTDLAGRLSDNRFIILFLDSDSRNSLIPALRIKKSMEILRFGPNLDHKLTMGMGIVTFPKDVEEIGGMISLASRSLERSKQKGKGMITLASSLWKYHP